MSEFSNFLVLDLEYKNLVLNLQDNKNDKKKKKKFMYFYQFMILWLGFQDLKNVTYFFDIGSCLHLFLNI